MKIVIDIPEEVYNRCKEYRLQCGEAEVLESAVARGTPLSKGHGRLIDADKLLGSDGIIADSRKCHYIPMIDVYQAQTIIEADRAESEE